MLQWLYDLLGINRAKVKAEVKEKISDAKETVKEKAVAKAKVVKTKVADAKSDAVDLANMKKAELLEHAKKVKVKVAATATKTQIIKAINDATK